jgi:hypothetical protein
MCGMGHTLLMGRGATPPASWPYAWSSLNCPGMLPAEQAAAHWSIGRLAISGFNPAVHVCAADELCNSALVPGVRPALLLCIQPSAWRLERPWRSVTFAKKDHSIGCCRTRARGILLMYAGWMRNALDDCFCSPFVAFP